MVVYLMKEGMNAKGMYVTEKKLKIKDIEKKGEQIWTGKRTEAQKMEKNKEAEDKEFGKEGVITKGEDGAESEK